ESWLRHCHGAFSFCSGSGTAEMARAHMEQVINRERSTALQDPFEVLDAVREACSATPGARATIRNFLVSSKNEILLEASDLASRRGLIFRPDQMNMEYLLNQRERETIKILNARYHLKFQKHPWENEELVYYLGGKVVTSMAVDDDASDRSSKRSTRENHMKDIMEAVEKVKCGKSFLNTLTSKQLRLGFYGMFRLDKKELTELLTTEYQRLGSVLSGDKSLMDLIKLVEIELSRNTTFTVMNLSNGRAMLESKGVIKELPTPAEGKASETSAKSVSEKMPNLDLDTIVASDEPTAQVPIAPMPGQQIGKGVNEIGQKGKALVAVCHCDYDLAACGACGKGWSQEKAAGRDPKMIPESDVKKPGGGGGGGGPQTEGNDGEADHGGVKGDEGAKKTDPHEGPAGGENEKDKEDDAVAEPTVKKARTDDSTPESTGTGAKASQQLAKAFGKGKAAAKSKS
ncbi:unnamed protein product, partial [Cladocopium goreaui]